MTVRTDAALRGLLRTARRTCKMTQQQAADKAGISRTWWKRVESASMTTVSEDTLTTMAEAVGILPEHLTVIGHDRLAGLLRQRLDFRCTTESTDLEQYLMKAPVNPAVRQGLVIAARTLLAIQRGRESDPFADQFPPPDEE